MKFFYLYRNLLAIIIICLMITGCTNWDITDPGPQPIDLENTEHEPKLNVLGILRPDTLNGLPLSFVHVEFSFPINDFPDSNIVPDANVKLNKLVSGLPVDSSDFHFTDLGFFPALEYRNLTFFPEKGAAYQLICEWEGYPTLTAQAVLPDVPRIKEGTLSVTESNLSFEIIRDEQVGLYEINLVGNNWLLKNRILRPAQGNVPVDFSLTGACPGECMLKIFAFDNNLSEYFTVNLSIKPNIYQKEFSTVENGYGCFGALNIFEVELEL